MSAVLKNICMFRLQDVCYQNMVVYYFLVFEGAKTKPKKSCSRPLLKEMRQERRMLLAYCADYVGSVAYAGRLDGRKGAQAFHQLMCH